jgi:uncharacterized protein YbjT (DUF2867 family)
MIAVAGATGRLGTLIVRELTAHGQPVRVLTRDPSRARHLAAAEIRTCDVRNRADTIAAVEGVTAVVSAVHGFAGPGRVSPESVDRDGNANLIAGAVATRADVVLMSVIGAAADHPMELFRAKHAAEQELRGAGAGWTIVRSSAFVELWAEMLTKAPVFGRGENPINFVSVDDVAAVVARAVAEPGLRGRVLEVGGPDNMTLNELAARVRGAAPVRRVPLWLVRALARLDRRPAAALAMDTIDMTFAGERAPELAGLPVTDLETALRRHAAADGSGGAGEVA